jgi:hypothetical protein
MLYLLSLSLLLLLLLLLLLVLLLLLLLLLLLHCALKPDFIIKIRCVLSFLKFVNTRMCSFTYFCYVFRFMVYQILKMKLSCTVKDKNNNAIR